MSDLAADNYFELRKVNPDVYENFALPVFLTSRLPKDKNALVVDFGCGFGHMLGALRKLGYTNLAGVEINEQAIVHCLSNGINVVRSLDEIGSAKADMIIMSHVLEHLPKSSMREALSRIKEQLRPDGFLLICVPNAQSAIGAYWAYEDFTHECLFTSGSLHYITTLAGFREVRFIDIDCTEGLGPVKKFARKLLLRIYKSQVHFWNKVTASDYHSMSEEIFSSELKAVCRK